MAARESAGVPVRYLPVRTPRPSGDHGRTPRPAGVVGDADVRRPAAAHREVERAEGLLDRGARVPGVHLPQVDVVDAQPTQRGVEGGEQRPAGGVDVGASVAGADGRLGRDHELVAVRDVAQQGAEQLLRAALGVRRRRVHQGPAGLHEGDQLVAGLVLVGVTAPGHRPEPQSGDPQPGVADGSLLHGRKPIGTAGSCRRRLAGGTP